MEYLRDRNGNDYFMEINMRNDGNGICVTGAGVNLPYIWYQYCVGEDYQKEASNTIKDIFVMPEFDDFRNYVVSRRISLWDWIKDIRKTDVFMEFSNNDRMPFFCMLKRFIKSGCKGFHMLSNI